MHIDIVKLKFSLHNVSFFQTGNSSPTYFLPTLFIFRQWFIERFPIAGGWKQEVYCSLYYASWIAMKSQKYPHTISNYMKQQRYNN